MEKPTKDAEANEWAAWAAARGKALKADLTDDEALADLREMGSRGLIEIAYAVGTHLPNGWYEDTDERRGAQTGSLYTVYCSEDLEDEDGDSINIKVRFADHGECYCSEDLSCDPDGLTPAQVINELARRLS